MLDPKQGYNHAKFEIPSLHSVHQKGNIKASVNSENMSIISLEYVQEWKIVVYTLPTQLTFESYKVSTSDKNKNYSAIAIMQSSTFNTIYHVQENPTVKVYDRSRHLIDQKHVNYLP